jgi:hypothetical protein
LNITPNRAEIAVAKAIIETMDHGEYRDYDASDYAVQQVGVQRRDFNNVIAAVASARHRGWTLGDEHEKTLNEVAHSPRTSAPRSPSVQSIMHDMSIVNGPGIDVEGYLVPDNYASRLVPPGTTLPMEVIAHVRNLQRLGDGAIRNHIQNALAFPSSSETHRNHLAAARSQQVSTMEAIARAVHASPDLSARATHTHQDRGTILRPMWYGIDGEVIGQGAVPPPGAIGVEIPQLDQTEPDEM